MNINSLINKFGQGLPVLALSLCLFACNNDDKGNNSSAGGMEADTSMMGRQTTVGPAPGSDTGTMTGSATGVNGAGGSMAASDTTGMRKARKGRVTAAMSADDMSAKMEMDKQGYYNRTEVSPMYATGDAGLNAYLTDNLQYPQQALDNAVEGQVRVQFAVDNKGNVSNVSTLGNKLGYGLEEEAMKVISRMPQWKPGIVKGKTVKTWRIIPINYKLDEGTNASY